jgi:hypothetical protein
MKNHSSRSSASCSIDRYASTISKFGIKGGLNYANQNGSDITVNSIIMIVKLLPAIM